MRINIKARLRNKYFWISFISLVIILMEQLGIQLPFDLNEVSATILSMLVALGVVVDNGTKGFCDNESQE